MKTPPKGTIVDKNNLQPGELIQTNFVFYNVTSIRGFTSMLTVVCENNRMLWLFPTASKQAPVCIIRFILTTFKKRTTYMQTCESLWIWSLVKINRCYQPSC